MQNVQVCHNGPGVYITNIFIYAINYSNSFVNDGGVPKKMSYFFINKVRHTRATNTPTKLSKDNLEIYARAKVTPT